MTYYNPPRRDRHWDDEDDRIEGSSSPMAPRANRNYGYSGHLATLSPGNDEHEDPFERQNYSHRRKHSKYSIYQQELAESRDKSISPPKRPPTKARKQKYSNSKFTSSYEMPTTISNFRADETAQTSRMSK